MYVKHFLFCICSVLLVACEKQSSQQVDIYTVDSALVDDPKALPILVDRLRANLKVEDDTIVVDREGVRGSFVISRNTPWIVSCGTGLTVYFETAEVDLLSQQLTIDNSKCLLFGRRIGQELRAILKVPVPANY